MSTSKGVGMADVQWYDTPLSAYVYRSCALNRHLKRSEILLKEYIRLGALQYRFIRSIIRGGGLLREFFYRNHVACHDILKLSLFGYSLIPT